MSYNMVVKRRCPDDYKTFYESRGKFYFYLVNQQSVCNPKWVEHRQ